MATTATAELVCPGCKKKLRVPAASAGKAIRCPGCQKTLKLPSAGAQPKAHAKGAASTTGSRSTTKAPVACTHCRATLQVPTHVIGKRIQCPKCRKPFQAQAAGKPAANSVAAAPDPLFPPVPKTVAAAETFPLTESDFDLNASGFGSPIGPQPKFQHRAVATKEAELPDEADVPGGGVRNRNLYVLPATLTIVAGVINIIGFLGLAILSLVLAVLTFSIVGIAITLIVGAAAIGNCINTILGGVNILRMVDRRHGIWAGNMLLISPFFALGFCAWRISIIIGFIVFFACLLYTWPVGWWMVLLLGRKQASRDFDEDPDFV